MPTHSCGKAVRCILYGLIVFLFTTNPVRSQAQNISGADLFLSPVLVPTDFYDAIVLNTGDSRAFSILDVPGATQLQGLRILPLLNANPNTIQGEYSSFDLAGINVCNYHTFFNALPDVDYSATQIT